MLRVPSPAHCALAASIALSGCNAIFDLKEGRPMPDGASGNAGTAGSAGSAGSAGTAGSAGDVSGGAGQDGGNGGTGASPSGVGALPQTTVDKVDLLFMIDNSVSMADKQAILVRAVPGFVARLIDPICVDGAGNPTGDASSANGCDAGIPEFRAVGDIHVGVVTSSLGHHGGEVCVDAGDMPPRTLNDRAQLIASMRSGLYSYLDRGFLVWDPRVGNARPMPEPHPGLSNHETNAADFVEDFASHIASAGERGCGFEAPLEAWYRFLVDPEPVATVAADMVTGLSVRGPINDVVLAQRRAFLRPDSLLAVVMLTDENDCSILDENDSQGWLVGRRTQMPRASSECLRPGDPVTYACCRPCSIDLPGCPSSASDAECAKGVNLTMLEDAMNLRCIRQKERFGLDFLYPTERYVKGLLEPFVKMRDGSEARNPIYTPGEDGTPARDPSRVVLAGIVGVPWQDLATEQSFSGPALTYLTADELAAEGRWDVILGDPETGREPHDPHMIESVEERVSTVPHPLLGEIATIVPSTSATRADPISGHEQNITSGDDLQYACIFELDVPVPCDMANQDGCECNASEWAYNRALCEYPSGTMPVDGTQTHAKAYPGVRLLEVLRDFGSNAVVASICPKDTSTVGEADPGYGYNPAMTALVDGVKGALAPGCLASPLAADANGEVPCQVVEARRSEGACSCDAGTGRADLPETAASTRSAIEGELETQGLCGPDAPVPCDDYCLCEIRQFSGGDLETCLTSSLDRRDQHGFCYVDGENGNSGLVADCPPSRRRRLRFMGAGMPAPRTPTFISCEE